MFQLGPGTATVHAADETPVSLHGGEGILYIAIDDGTTRVIYINDDVPRMLDASGLFGKNVA